MWFVGATCLDNHGTPIRADGLTNADCEASLRGSKVIAVILNNNNPVLAKDAFFTTHRDPN